MGDEAGAAAVRDRFEARRREFREEQIQRSFYELSEGADTIPVNEFGKLCFKVDTKMPPEEVERAVQRAVQRAEAAEARETSARAEVEAGEAELKASQQLGARSFASKQPDGEASRESSQGPLLQTRIATSITVVG